MYVFEKRETMLLVQNIIYTTGDPGDFLSLTGRMYSVRWSIEWTRVWVCYDV